MINLGEKEISDEEKFIDNLLKVVLSYGRLSIGLQAYLSVMDDLVEIDTEDLAILNQFFGRMITAVGIELERRSKDGKEEEKGS